MTVAWPQGCAPVHMTTEPAARQLIADSRALYFSGLVQPPVEPEKERDSGQRKPSYVGLSHSINGYTPYAPYNGRVKKISPPIQIPVSPPKTLDSVSLVLNQDSYQKSLGEFESVMRDLSNTSIAMGRPDRGTDMTDHTKITADQRILLINSHNGDNYFPKTHSRQLIGEGEGAVVEIVTKFHSDGDHSPTYSSPGGSRQNLVQKQIERLYGDNQSQVRMTSPEPRDSPERSNGSTPDNESSSDGQESIKAERKLSGGFFAKRFGITKMKDHSTRKLIDTNSANNSPMEFKPLKVPAVFRLLRPEFREQLKQSSCKVEIPLTEDQRKERIIPIRREGESLDTPSKNGTPVSNSSRESTPGSEIVVPITVIENTSTPTRQMQIVNGNNNNVSNVSPVSTPERIVPIRRESGDITITPKRPTGLVPKVNGFSPAKQASLMGLRNGTSSRTETKNSESTDPVKQTVVRKLSPLSPKHIVVPTSSEKPATMPKPEHLKSPPMSPTPGSPSTTPIARQKPMIKPVTPPKPLSPSHSPVPPIAVPQEQSTVSSNGQEEVVPLPKPAPRQQQNGDIKSPHTRTVETVTNLPKPLLSPETSINTISSVVNNNHGSEELDESYEEYERTGDDFESPEQVYHRMQQQEREEEEEYYYDQAQSNQICGLRERELLCPIMEEDNESTASGSISNLALASGQVAHVPVIGNGQSSGYSPDDPLLITEKGEVQDGHFFIKVLENEIFKFEEKICDWEEDLNNGQEIPDEARDTILTVVGMAKLLMAQKLTQFRGLCDKHNNVTREEDPFVPTSQDLAGFWDMVHIQVEQIHTRFAGLHELKRNGWTIKAPEIKNTKSKGKKNAGVNKPIKPKEKSEAAKKRDEARKKMLEDRKKAMKEKSQKKEEDGDLIIIM